MKANGIIAFLTDFGTSDWYVASMKASALNACRELTFVDITHEIGQGALREGAFVLERCFDDFPEGTTFVVVVDPGVGTKREPVIVKAGSYYLVGPNNGVLYPTIHRLPQWEAVQIENPAWMGKKRSSTFHGRDLFAPAGAKVAGGADFREAGKAIRELAPLIFPLPQNNNGLLQGEILYFDKFGNALTNFRRDQLKAQTLQGIRVADVLFPLANTFGEVEKGDPVSYWGSSGFLELARRDGNSREQDRLSEGQAVDLVLTLPV